MITEETTLLWLKPVNGRHCKKKHLQSTVLLLFSVLTAFNGNFLQPPDGKIQKDKKKKNQHQGRFSLPESHSTVQHRTYTYRVYTQKLTHTHTRAYVRACVYTDAHTMLTHRHPGSSLGRATKSVKVHFKSIANKTRKGRYHCRETKLCCSTVAGRHHAGFDIILCQILFSCFFVFLFLFFIIIFF